MPFLPPNQQRQSTEGNLLVYYSETQNVPCAFDACINFKCISDDLDCYGKVFSVVTWELLLALCFKKFLLISRVTHVFFLQSVY